LYVHINIHMTRRTRLAKRKGVLAMEQMVRLVVQGGEDPYDALSLQVIFRKRALSLVALLRKVSCNLRHPMGLRHPVGDVRNCAPYACKYTY